MIERSSAVMETISDEFFICAIDCSRDIWVGGTHTQAGTAERAKMRVGSIDKHGAPIPLLTLIRTLTVGLRISLSQPPIGYVRVADFNRRFEITSTPLTTALILVQFAECKNPAQWAGFLNGVGISFA
jgi:hypothetical protein